MVVLLTGCRHKMSEPDPTRETKHLSRLEFLRRNELVGRVVLVEFGSIGCEPRGEGLEAMMRLVRQKTTPGLTFCRVEAEKDRAAAEEYFAQKSPGFAVVYDEDGSAAKAFDVTAPATFVLVGKFGRVRYRGDYPGAGALAHWTECLVSETSDSGADAEVFGVVKFDTVKLLEETKLPEVAGPSKSLADYVGRRGLLVVFTDTECPWAGKALGEMPTVCETLLDRGIPSVVVNIGDEEAVVLPFYAKRNAGAPVLYDATRKTQTRWNVRVAPTVMLFARTGKLVYRGNAVWSRLARAAEELLNVKTGAISFDAEGTEYG